jgi:dUTP pyrophosphatase
MGQILTATELHYLLGFGFSDFKAYTPGLILTKKWISVRAMEDISYRIYNQNKVKKNSNALTLIIEDKKIVEFLIANGVTASKKYMPTLTAPMKPIFAAGYFEGYGDFDRSQFFVRVPQKDVGVVLEEQWGIPNAEKMITNGYKALDVMGNIAAHTVFKDSDKIGFFLDMLNRPEERSNDTELRNRKFYYHKLSPKAVSPHKVRVTDSGYDLHVVEMTKLYTTPFGAEVYKAKTELAVKPSMGQAFDIAGRSSLPDKGWVFLQGVGICDRSYIGGIQATMMKLSDAPMPDFPWKCLQLVPRQSPIHLPFEESKNLGNSDRGHGGFGSTD